MNYKVFTFIQAPTLDSIEQFDTISNASVDTPSGATTSWQLPNSTLTPFSNPLTANVQEMQNRLSPNNLL